MTWKSSFIGKVRSSPSASSKAQAPKAPRSMPGASARRSPPLSSSSSHLPDLASSAARCAAVVLTWSASPPVKQKLLPEY